MLPTNVSLKAFILSKRTVLEVCGTFVKHRILLCNRWGEGWPLTGTTMGWDAGTTERADRSHVMAAGIRVFCRNVAWAVVKVRL